MAHHAVHDAHHRYHLRSPRTNVGHAFLALPLFIFAQIKDNTLKYYIRPLTHHQDEMRTPFPEATVSQGRPVITQATLTLD